MKNITIAYLILVSLSAYGQGDSTSSDSSISSTDSEEITNVCKELGIPVDKEANLDLLIFALDWRGTSYCYGGSTKECTDCSGFTSRLYSSVYKKQLPRVSRDIYQNCMPLRKHALYQGDLVFFATSGTDAITHMGVYLWDGYFVHASSSKGVTVSNLSQKYYMKHFVVGGAWLE